MALKKNTWTLNQWYDQDVAGNVDYTGERVLFMSGDNNYGQLGQNNRTLYSSPVQLPGTTWNYISGSQDGNTTLVRTDNTLWFLGYNDDGTSGQNGNPFTKYSSPVQIPGTNWKRSVSVINSVLATRTDGTLWAWGGNRNGILGQNQSPPGGLQSSPIQIPGTTWDEPFGSYNEFVGCNKTDGTLWMWGYGNYGNLGNNDNDHDNTRSSPIQIPGSTWTNKNVAGVDNMLSLKSDGTLWTWGRNHLGQLGQNNRTSYSSPVQIPGTWSDFSIGMRNCHGIKTDGTLWSWGYGNYGSLGLNSNNDRSSPTQVTGDTWKNIVAAKGAIATKTDGTLWTWGENDEGQGGLNDTVKRSSPTQIPGTGTWNIENQSNQNGKYYFMTLIK